MNTDNVIALKEEQIISFFIKYPDFFIKNISHNYPLSDKLIERYMAKWNWGELGRNKNLNWSIQLIKKFENEWDWDGYYDTINNNSSIPWSIELIEIFDKQWNWGYHGLSDNEALPWSIELLKKFEDKWNWDRLSKNKALPWSVELLELFKDKWSWSTTLSVEYDPDGQIHSGGLSANEKLPWSIELIKKYEDRWDWGCLSRNRGLPWSTELIEIFEGKWDWENIVNLSLPIEIIEKFKDKIDFGKEEFNKLDEIYWIKEFYKNPVETRPMFEDIYKPISSNDRKHVWSADLIKKLEDTLNWADLSSNEYLPWSIELIKRYESKWDWRNLSANKKLPWSLELIKIFENKWSWDKLCSNSEQLLWSIEFIVLLEKYRIKQNIVEGMNYYIIYNNVQWNKVFKPYVNDTTITKAMEGIERKITNENVVKK